MKHRLFNLGLALVLAAAAAPALFAAGEADAGMAASGDLPEVWIWPTMALTDPNGSNPDKLA